MSIVPTQIRTIDPYQDYNSNAVNRLTQMVTNGLDCIIGATSADISIDPANPTTKLILSAGEFFKDDVYIQITSNFTIDMTDPDFYVAGVRDEAGIYYIVVDYVYTKSRPAPQASIKIIRPSDHGLYNTTQYMFIKAVTVTFVGPGFTIGELYDHDPANLSIKRVYPPNFAGICDTLPTWTASDESRILYVRSERECYFGTNIGWESFSAIRDNQNTSLCNIGDVAYIGSDNALHPAIIDSTSLDSIADCVIVNIDDTYGRVRLAGYCSVVNVEAGITPSTGDKIYLSDFEAGTVTNIATTGNTQYLGVCLGNNGDGTIEMWFVPLVAYNTSIQASLNQIESDIVDLQTEINGVGHVFRDSLSGADWVSDGTMYKATVTHNLGNELCNVSCYDHSTKKMIQPADIEIIDLNSLYVWMTINTITVDIIVIG